MVAVYPRSFDPITSGHLDIIERASSLYDEVIVLVAVNSSKKPAFSLEERVALIKASIEQVGLTNVRVDSFGQGLLVDYVEKSGARVIVKGLRALSDFEYEFQMALLNRKLKPTVETVFMMTGTEYSYLSSSIVKEIARLGGDITDLVPRAVFQRVLDRFAGESTKSAPKTWNELLKRIGTTNVFMR